MMKWDILLPNLCSFSEFRVFNDYPLGNQMMKWDILLPNLCSFSEFRVFNDYPLGNQMMKWDILLLNLCSFTEFGGNTLPTQMVIRQNYSILDFTVSMWVKTH